MAINVSAAKRGFLYNPASQSLGIYVNGVNVADYPTNMGRVYHVNNITGSSGADGLSWGSAMDQVSTAIDASEVYRQLGYGKPDVTTNDYVRNTILVQGTGTAYTLCDSLPNYCDIIGIGADPRGNGGGIARVSATTGVDTVDEATGVRGLNIYNMQFTGSGTGYAMDLAVAFRCRFENCVFTNKSTGGIRILTGGGIVIKDCSIGAADTTTCTTGLTIGSSGGNFNNCLVENNVIHGTTLAINNTAYLCNGTRFDHNLCFSEGTYAISDTSSQTGYPGLAWYTQNFVRAATTAFVITNGSGRAIGNLVVNNTTGATLTEYTDQ